MENTKKIIEKQKAPYSIRVLILGIISLISSVTVIGGIFGLIGLMLSEKSRKEYLKNPTVYSKNNYERTGRVLSIIGMICSALMFLFILVIFAD